MELLTVISIIALLISILLPQLTSAREYAQRIKCQSNMRNLTFAWQQYTIDNRDLLCSANTGWNNMGIGQHGNNWVSDGPGPMFPFNAVGGTEKAIKDGSLWQYVKTLEIYKCKMDKSEMLRSYAISRAMNGKTCGCVNDNVRPYKSYTSIKQPSERLVVIDAFSRMKWIDGSFCPVHDIKEEPPKWSISNSINITARHGGGTNISFADGHCDYLKWKDRRTIKLSDWKINFCAASENNSDLRELVTLLKGQ